jgi:hypothetical protein
MIQMGDNEPDGVLGVLYFFNVPRGLLHHPSQPFLAAVRFGKVDLMENGKLLLMAEDRKVVVCGFIYLHLRISSGRVRG